MKQIFAFLLIPIYMYGVTLRINSSKENNQIYKILHVKNDKPVLCEEKEEKYGKKVYLCIFDGNLKNQIKNKKTPFVDIDFITKKNKFYIYIKPKFNSFLVDTDAKLFKSKTTPFMKKESSKHWTIFLYNEKNPFKNQNKGINFPVTYSKFQYPYIGTLDLNGKPMDYAKSNDINIYLKLKKAYKKEEYQEALYIAEKIIKQYPNSIFMSDILLLKLMSMDKILDDKNIQTKIDRTDVATETKVWLKTFSTDKSRPKALLLLVKQYLNLHLKNDVNYYLDMLLSEYPKDVNTQQAIILYANYLYKSGKKTEAIKLYEDVLYSSNDIDVASQAAIRLAQTSLEKGKAKKAKEYLQKVLGANEDFIQKNKTISYQLAQKLTKNGLFDVAAKISQLLLEKSKKFDENREVFLKDTGLWYEKAGNTEMAYKYLKQYLKKYPHGDYKILVQQALDRLFFKQDETNATKLIAYYDKLISQYNNNIKQKALIAKAQLLIKQKKYSDAFDMEEQLLNDKNSTKAADIMEKAAALYIKSSIEKDDCKTVVKIAGKYPNILTEIQKDEGLYRCFLRFARYNDAKNVAKRHMEETKLSLKLEWMLKLQHALYKNGEFENSLKIAKDIEALGEILQSSLANIALYDRFYALAKLKRFEKALNIAKLIEEKFPKSFKNAEVFANVVKIAKNQGNDLVVVSYAKKALELQKEAKSYLLSPKLEYDYIQALQNLNRNNLANKIALELLQRGLKDRQKARAFYYIAESFVKIDDDKNASKYFLKCKDSDKNSSWSLICKENLDLLDINKTKKP